MRILFVMLHPGFIRYYDGALRGLAAAGHDVHVAFEITREKLGEDVTARRLAEASPRITCGTTPPRSESVRTFLARGDRGATRAGYQHKPAWSREARAEAWESLATTVRLMLDYLRYFEPAFSQASALRARAEKRLPRLHAAIVRTIARGGEAARTLAFRMLSGTERLIPSNPALEGFIRDHHPDLLLVTPLIELGSQQVDYVKSARRLGVPSALCVASWDNLTSKGLIRVIPDRVTVWNEVQKEEAVTLHGVAPERVLVTGAQLFDDWFDARPSRSREQFCRDVGLDPSLPFVLYVGSSMFIAPDEVPFATRWLRRVRTSNEPPIASLGVLFRPHPANSRQWRTLETGTFDNVAVWPPIGTDPNAADFRRDYFDSLYHCAAVVGINTSAQLEAAIVDRPVLTVRAPEFAHAQEGTLHYRHLATIVREAATLDEHVTQLSGVLRADAGREARRRFVGSFIRPHGLDKPAVPQFVNAIESIDNAPAPAPERHPWWATAALPFTAVVAYLARELAEDRPLWVYLLRPFVTVFVWLTAIVFWVRDDGAALLHLGLKRTRRAVHGGWYEFSSWLGKSMRRLRKSVSRSVLDAGVTAKRAVRRTR